MKNTNLVSLMAAPVMVLALSLPAWAADPASTTCKDGTTSSATGRGACSGHGGVQKRTEAAAAPAGRSTRRRCGRVAGFGQNLQGWHDFHRRRTRCMQRPRRRAEIGEGRPGGPRRRSRGSRGAHGGQGLGSVDVGAHGYRRQLRSGRCDGEVQGWYVFEIETPFGHVFQTRRRGRVADALAAADE